MAALSDYAEVALRRHFFRSGTYTKPSTLAVALAISSTSDANTGATIPEVPDANDYARVEHNPSDGNWDAPNDTDGLTQNSADITFPTASGSWGTISHVGIVDSSAFGAGNMLFHGALSSSKSVGTNDIFQFPANALQVIFQ